MARTRRMKKTLVSAVTKCQRRRISGAGRGSRTAPDLKVVPVVRHHPRVCLLRVTISFDFFGYIPKIDSTISLAALFVTGLFTSVHCIAMCGNVKPLPKRRRKGAAKKSLRNPLLYNLGRVISYTVIGGIVGGIGSVLFLSETVKAILLALAAIGMLLMGLSMLGWLPWWLTPRMLQFLSSRIGKKGAGKGLALVVGLLNGFMPCPVAAVCSSMPAPAGSILTGALSCSSSHGTVPLMLGAGALLPAQRSKFAFVVQRVSAVLVVFFAVVMAANALSILGVRSATTLDGSRRIRRRETKSSRDSLLQQALDRSYVPRRWMAACRRFKRI
ncbi:MAG: sulfite exporter TauE/SafE family protein [Eubacteriales bacterium]